MGFGKVIRDLRESSEAFRTGGFLLYNMPKLIGVGLLFDIDKTLWDG
ncbi:hypothetical protein SBF1_2230006 [Candidatus Desulfosporosinus infrequens]|uniref:Uncharacterized protein n=1 Tax=Candidatus Desulfosporosinus infrequens TaxID=2043169 RepID=A0A2U3KLB1_9FIRM|nr:hypothetical protein SBF1_2230006 [Candidatus Desulfosporosinus infrequens]